MKMKKHGLAASAFGLTFCMSHSVWAQVELQRTCPPVEIVFALDTSGSMDDESTALCETISTIQGELAEKGIDASATIWGIAEYGLRGFECLTGSVFEELGGSVPGEPGSCGYSITRYYNESWSPAATIIAERFPWAEDTVRVVVPVSDEAPCFGDPCHVDGWDGESVRNAIEIAVANRAYVSPIIGTGGSTCTIDHATQLANQTGGAIFLSQDPELDIAEAVTALVEDACETVLACKVNGATSVANPGSDGEVKVEFSEDGIPAEGLTVSLRVVEGPNASVKAESVTLADGTAVIKYASNGNKGVDTIEASCVDSLGRSQVSLDTMLQFWDEDANGNGIPDECDVDCTNFGGKCSEFVECGKDPVVAEKRCGDGVVNQESERCDDGNNADDDGCSSDCKVEETSKCPKKSRRGRKGRSSRRKKGRSSRSRKGSSHSRGKHRRGRKKSTRRHRRR